MDNVVVHPIPYEALGATWVVKVDGVVVAHCLGTTDRRESGEEIMADNFGRNVHEVTVDGPLKGSFKALVHAVNRESAIQTATSFEVKLVDAPDYCITIPDLGILQDPADHEGGTRIRTVFTA